jgi:predicted nuclease with TOPRIM domain
MRAKKVLCSLTVLLLFSALLCSVNALSENTVTFRGEGVTIELTFPKEAHPGESIWHNITLTSTAATTLRNFTVVIKAPVNSTWVEILNSQSTFSWPLPYTFPPLNLSLPQDANGRLQCFIFANTSSIDDLSTTVYTTLVSDPTFSDLKNEYDTLLKEYTSLNASYIALNDDFTILWADYTALSDDYDSIAKYEALYNEYKDKYDALNANYKSKITDLGNLQTNFDDLNTTRNNLQTSYDTLKDVYETLNETYINLDAELDNLQDNLNVSEGEVSGYRIVTFMCVVAVAGLIALIVYLKRRKEEPYVVIRKETVNIKSDEET